MITNFPEKLNFLHEKLADLYEYFTSNRDYQKPVTNLKKKEHFFSKLETIVFLKKIKKERKKIFELPKFEKGEKSTALHLKNGTVLLACSF